MKVYPVPGRLIRDPATGREITDAEQGHEVPDNDSFWIRRLQDGDVSEAPPKAAKFTNKGAE